MIEPAAVNSSSIGESAACSCACCCCDFCQSPCCAVHYDDDLPSASSALLSNHSHFPRSHCTACCCYCCSQESQLKFDSACTVGRCCCIATAILLLLLGAGLPLFYFVFLKSSTPIIPPTPLPVSVPDAPSSLNVTSVDILSVSLAWLPPASTHGSAVLRYQVRVVSPDSPASPPLLLDAGQSLTFVADGLAPRTSYAFGVSACNSVGCGNYSQSAEATTLNASAPLPPGQPVLLASSPDSLSIDWSAAVPQGANITSYQVDGLLLSSPAMIKRTLKLKLHVGDEPWMLQCNSTTPSCTINSLIPGASYSLRVRALSAVQPSVWGINATYHTVAAGATVPDPPATIDLQDATSGSLTVRWLHPSSDGGSEIVGYVLQISNQSSSSDDPWSINSTLQLNVPLAEPIDTATVSVPALLPNITYLLRAASLNGLGQGVWSPTFAFATAAASPPSAPRDLQVMAADAASISLRWQSGVSPAAALPVLGQELQQDNWWLDQPLTPIYDGVDTAFVAANLLPASTYTFSARTRNAAGYSNLSDAVSFVTSDNGNCGNAADIRTFYLTKTSMKGDIQGCLIGCIGQGGDCAANCVHTKVGLSLTCAQCWAAEGQCTLDNCILPCLDPNSDACKQCSKDKCFPACVQCSGVPMWAFPP